MIPISTREMLTFEEKLHITPNYLVLSNVEKQIISEFDIRRIITLVKDVCMYMCLKGSDVRCWIDSENDVGEGDLQSTTKLDVKSRLYSQSICTIIWIPELHYCKTRVPQKHEKGKGMTHLQHCFTAKIIQSDWFTKTWSTRVCIYSNKIKVLINEEVVDITRLLRILIVLLTEGISLKRILETIMRSQTIVIEKDGDRKCHAAVDEETLLLFKLCNKSDNYMKSEDLKLIKWARQNELTYVETLCVNVINSSVDRGRTDIIMMSSYYNDDRLYQPGTIFRLDALGIENTEEQLC